MLHVNGASFSKCVMQRLKWILSLKKCSILTSCPLFKNIDVLMETSHSLPGNLVVFYFLESKETRVVSPDSVQVILRKTFCVWSLGHLQKDKRRLNIQLNITETHACSIK